MLWRCFQCELNSLITRIFIRFLHRNSKRLSYYNKHLIISNNFQSLVTQYPFKHDLIPMTCLLMKKVHLNLINLNVESLLLLSLMKVKSRKYAWSSDLFGMMNGFSLHNVIVIAPHSTRAAATQYFSPPIRRDRRSSWSEAILKVIFLNPRSYSRRHTVQ